MQSWAAAIEALPLARSLSASIWLYPLVNAGHVLGIALLLGAVVPLDLRLLGAWRAQPLLPLWRVLGQTAAAGLGLAMACGALLFVTRATEYLASPLFVAKMVCLTVGIGNAAWLRLKSGDSPCWHAQPPLHARMAAVVSLVAWLATMVLGRWIGYR